MLISYNKCFVYIIKVQHRTHPCLAVTSLRRYDHTGQNVNGAISSKSLAHKHFTQKEVSVQETVVRLSGYKLKQLSCYVVFI